MCLKCEDPNCKGCAVTALTEQLDPGIADVVIMLRNLGFNPTDSGDGRSKPDEERDFDVKHVACTWSGPSCDESARSEDPAAFLEDARRLHGVLGSSWRVQATFDPADNSCILLATKNEPLAPRHAEAMRAWPWEAREWSKNHLPSRPTAHAVVNAIVDRLRDEPVIKQSDVPFAKRVIEDCVSKIDVFASVAHDQHLEALKRILALYETGSALHKALEHELGRR